jgi:flagella basal body P-ring formation protein FlgA
MTPLVVLALAAGGCLPLDPAAPRITAGDLARAWPALAAVAASTPLAYVPAPGVERVFTPAELRRLGLGLGVATEPESAVCVHVPTMAPDPEGWLRAMRKSLPDARIELVDHSRYPVPAGEAVFPPGALHASGRWSGYIVYGGSRRFLVWARVIARVETTRVVAAEALRAGSVIAPSQVRLETVEVPPGAEIFAASLEEAVGRVARRTTAADRPLLRSMLGEAPLVKRGETVKVEVRRGAARLQLEAQAEADGRRGERIAVRNPETGKRFLVRVEDKGRAAAGEAGEQR